MMNSEQLEALSDQELEEHINTERQHLMVALDLCDAQRYRKARELQLMALQSAREMIATTASLVTNPAAYFTQLNRRH